MRNASYDVEEVQVEGFQLTQTSYVYLGGLTNVESDIKNEVERRRTYAWAAFGLLKEAETI